MTRISYVGFAPFPRQENGKTDKKALKQLYMDSQFIEWRLFCHSRGYNPDLDVVPHPKWKEEKKKKILDEKTSEIKDKLFEHSHRIHIDILDTVKKYPGYADNMMMLLNQYPARIAKAINDENKRLANGEIIKPQDSFLFKFDAKYMNNLASAFKTIAEMRYRTLMLDQFSVKNAEDQVKDPDAATKLDEVSGDLNFEVMTPGGLKMSDKDLTRLLGEYYDSPYKAEDQLFIEQENGTNQEE